MNKNLNVLIRIDPDYKYYLDELSSYFGFYNKSQTIRFILWFLHNNNDQRIIFKSKVKEYRMEK